MNKTNKKVAVALSGGVDSSFAAYLLKKQGVELIAVTMKLPFFKQDNIERAKKLCETLGIKHIVIDLTDYFEEKLIADFISQYLKGLTPNPCSLCNKRIKFGLLFEEIKKLGFDYIATGHYIKLDQQGSNFYLKRAFDDKKSQEYFLGLISKDILAHCIFPLGDYKKDDVKERMKDIFHIAVKVKESQEICFIKDKSYKQFIEQRLPDKEKYYGPIKHVNGKTLGFHKGIYCYTYGQRQGLGVAWKNPLYVVDIDGDNNTVYVGEVEYLFKDSCKVKDINWFYPPKEYSDIEVRLRYNSKAVNCSLQYNEKENEIICKFKKDQKTPTPGQLAVFYDKKRVMAAGLIKK